VRLADIGRKEYLRRLQMVAGRANAGSILQVIMDYVLR
jgi:hypothetical protein